MFPANAIPQQQGFAGNRTCLVDNSTFSRYLPSSLRARLRFSCEVRAELVRLPFVMRKRILW
jgi:hypothetical protein